MERELIYDDKEWFLNLFGNSNNLTRSYSHLQNLMKLIDCGDLRKSTSLDYCILEFLATQGANTLYRIQNDLGIRFSSLWNAASELEQNGFIRVVSKEKWRTGLQRKLLGITSIGLATIVAFHRPRMDGSLIINQYPSAQEWFEHSVKKDYISIIAQKNVHLPIFDFFFQNWDVIEKALNKPEPYQHHLIDDTIKLSLAFFLDKKNILYIFWGLLFFTGLFPPEFESDIDERHLLGKSNFLLEKPNKLKTFRRRANHWLMSAYFYALSLTPLHYQYTVPGFGPGHSRLLYRRIFLEGNELGTSFLTKYKPMLESSVKLWISGYREEQKRLHRLLKLLIKQNP